MANFSFEVTVGRPKARDYRILSDGMLKYHAQQGHQRASEVVNIFLKDNEKKMRGGVIVTILWNGMEINSLWVDEPWRGQGWGRRLVEAAENEGRKRGCTFAYTNTFTWQAPGFYEKLGYKIYGKLDDFPPGNTLTYYTKNL